MGKNQAQILPTPDIQAILKSSYAPADGGIGDFSILYHKDEWHLFFIHRLFGKPASPHCSGQETAIGHATSYDLIDWQTQTDAIEARANHWDSAHLWAPSVVSYCGLWYMFYTGTDENIRQRIGLAVSDDLEHWRYPIDKPVIDALDWPWAKAGGVLADSDLHGYVNCRDPFVKKLGGQWACCYTALSDSSNAVIAAALSDNLTDWRDHGILAERPIQNNENKGTYMMESPFIFEYNDRCYLVYNQAAGIKYVISDDPLDFSAGDTKVLVDNFYNFEMIDIQTGLFACADMNYYSSLHFGQVEFDPAGLMHIKSLYRKQAVLTKE